MTQREAFEAWWAQFQEQHDEWRFADREALMFGAWQAAQAQAAVPDEFECPNCLDTGKVLVYGIEESWEEQCSYCVPKAEVQPVKGTQIASTPLEPDVEITWVDGDDVAFISMMKAWTDDHFKKYSTLKLYASPPDDLKFRPDWSGVEVLGAELREAQKAMRLALEALLNSRDDVYECKANLMPKAGYPRYDRQITAYKEQLEKHDAAIAALEGSLK